MTQAKPPRRALFIVNPNARSGRKPIDPIRKALETGGLTLVDASPDKDESISDLIRRMQDACDLVIIGGGDGTLNAAAAGLVETGLPLGVLPLGTANDFARTIGLPPVPLKAVELILSSEPRPIDLGEVNGNLFFNVASIGFSAELAAELTEKAKKRWGKLGYAMVAARLLARSRLFTAYVEH
ncbi:unnamed protein product, partial [marine sediment metagenome]